MHLKFQFDKIISTLGFKRFDLVEYLSYSAKCTQRAV